MTTPTAHPEPSATAASPPLRTAARCASAALLLLAAPSPAPAQAVDVSPGARSAARADGEDAFFIYLNADTGSFVKPVIGLAAGLNYEIRKNDTQPRLKPLTTTPATVLFGVEGRYRDWATFHSEFRRDPGFQGTSVWEGTVSLSSLDNYLRLERWNATLAAGIVTDPASVDFFSAHQQDLFGADYYTRLTLLHGGFNRAQGVVGQYRFRGLTAGISFSSGNPLASSLSFGFGGAVSPMGNLFQFPLRTISNGSPAAGMQLTVATPSVMFQHERLEVRAAVQLSSVILNTEDDTALPLRGQLYRAAARLKLLGGALTPFANVAFRRNDEILQSAPPDATRLNPEDYRATVFSAGLDYDFLGASGVGASYGYVGIRDGTNAPSALQFVHVGATYWITEHLAASVRYSKLITTTKGEVADGIPDKDAFFVITRLVI